MATARVEPPVLAKAASLALGWGGWLALGELGRQLTPLWLGGLLPLVVGLAFIGAASRLGALAAPACLLNFRGDWVLRSALAAMLPMMGSLGEMSELCAAGGLSRPWIYGLHLAAMLVPACLVPVYLVPHRPKTGWIAALMGASAVLLLAMPGVVGWMAASLLQSVAWGLAHAVAKPAGQGAALSSVAVLALLGYASSVFGPAAWMAAQAALGIVAAVAAAVAPVPPRAVAVEEMR